MKKSFLFKIGFMVLIFVSLLSSNFPVFMEYNNPLGFAFLSAFILYLDFYFSKKFDKNSKSVFKLMYWSSLAFFTLLLNIFFLSQLDNLNELMILISEVPFIVFCGFWFVYSFSLLLGNIVKAIHESKAFGFKRRV